MSQESAVRDADTLRVLGRFFLVLGLLVLVATLWAWGEYRAMVVNLLSGSLLTGVGGLMLRIARRNSLSNDKSP